MTPEQLEPLAAGGRSGCYQRQRFGHPDSFGIPEWALPGLESHRTCEDSVDHAQLQRRRQRNLLRFRSIELLCDCLASFEHNVVGGTPTTM